MVLVDGGRTGSLRSLRVVSILRVGYFKIRGFLAVGTTTGIGENFLIFTTKGHETFIEQINGY